MEKKYKILVTVLILLVLYGGQKVLAVNVSETCFPPSQISGTVCTGVSDGLAEGATGINPAQAVNLGFSVYKKDTFDPPICDGSRQIFNAVRHYIAGSTTNYEYLSAGSGQNIQFSFNSGVDQQKNAYVGVFYCWTSSQGTDKGSLDSLLGTLGTLGQTWSSSQFNITTRATTIDPICSQITDCSKYPVINDCTGNRCKLSPACQWKNNVCVQATIAASPTPIPVSNANYNFDIKNPIGISTFQELVNLIGRWIFNLSIPIAVIMIIWGGVQMLTAGAFPKQFDKGKDAVKWAVIGLAVVLIGKGFVTLVASILSLGK